MTVRVTILALSAMLLLLGCGGKSDEGAAEKPAAVDSTAAVTTGDPVPIDSLPLKSAASLREHAEAGFRVRWPSGCGKLKEQISAGATRRAAQEFIYTCQQHDDKGLGVSIRILRDAHGPDDAAPTPPMVVEMIEKQLQRAGVKPVRQRPLMAEGSEGMDVQAAEEDGAGEMWIRGLLAGADIYVLMAWNEAGGLIEDQEIVDFFASFRSD